LPLLTQRKSELRTLFSHSFCDDVYYIQVQIQQYLNIILLLLWWWWFWTLANKRSVEEEIDLQLKKKTIVIQKNIYNIIFMGEGPKYPFAGPGSNPQHSRTSRHADHHHMRDLTK
jgi:hypothetical protein